jgi:hypothetical protein
MLIPAESPNRDIRSYRIPSPEGGKARAEYRLIDVAADEIGAEGKVHPSDLPLPNHRFRQRSA